MCSACGHYKSHNKSLPSSTISSQNIVLKVGSKHMGKAGETKGRRHSTMPVYNIVPRYVGCLRSTPSKL